MKIVNQSFEILNKIDLNEILKQIEKIGRVSYQSYDRITETSHLNFYENIVKNKHEGLLEHYSISIKIITDRATANQIIRHRLASYVQESTRFINYTKDKFNGLTFVLPYWIDKKEIEKIENNIIDVDEKIKIWYETCKTAEENYFKLITNGSKPQEARIILPLSLKTELVMTTNLRNLKHIIITRTGPTVDPQTKKLFEEIKKEFLWLF